MAPVIGLLLGKPPGQLIGKDALARSERLLQMTKGLMSFYDDLTRDWKFKQGMDGNEELRLTIHRSRTTRSDVGAKLLQELTLLARLFGTTASPPPCPRTRPYTNTACSSPSNWRR